VRASDAARAPGQREHGIRAVLPGDASQRQLPVATATQIPPQVSEWLPDLLRDLLPTTTTSLRRLANQYDDQYDMNIVETRRPGPFVYEYLCEVHGVDAFATHYASALTEYVLKYEPADYTDLSKRHQEQYDDLEQFLTQFGTGAGPFDRGIDALDRGPIAVHRQDPTPQTVWITLDAQAWRDVSDRRTAARSLSALATLGEAFDVAVVVSSPRLFRALRRHHREWAGEHFGDLDFTQHGIPTREQQDPAAEAIDAQTTAITGLADLDEQGGRIRVLDALPTEDYREQRMLIDDPTIDLAESTVSAYLSDLTDLGLVTIEREGRTHNHVSITTAGEIAQDYIADDYTLRSPQQTTLDTDFTPTPHGPTSRVYRTPHAREGGETRPSPEEWLADTGDMEEDGYVQWLDGPSEVLDNYAMHERLVAAQRTDGVTLVDHDVAAFDDGRATYLSCFRDHVLGIVQWGGPLPTLVRITTALLSDLAFSRLLTPDALGEEFEALYEECREHVERILVQGAQVGWFGEDEHDYEGFKDRYRGVRNRCLERLPEVLAGDDPSEYGDLLRDVHGLFAATTQLYHAAGMDVTVQLRVPDTAQLCRDDDRYQSFVDFFGHTVPKHTVYESEIGVHSGYREVLEQREEKLRSRLDYDLDITDPQADCTVSWVVSGPTVTEFEQDIYSAIQRRAATIREDVREGDEDAPLLEIPVLKGTTYPAIKTVIDRIAGQKGYFTDRAELLDQGVRDRRPIERCHRLFVACLSSTDRPGELSPFDVAEALLHCARTDRVEPLSVADVTYGLAHLPATRLLPELAPTATKAVQELLLADGPLGMTEIVERAGISESSYNRHIEDLAALAILEPQTVEGRRKWSAHLEPWWAPGSSATEPHGDESSLLEGWSPWLRDVLSDVIETVDPELEDALSWPPDIEAVVEQADGLEPWLVFISAHFGVADPGELTANERGEDLLVPDTETDPPDPATTETGSANDSPSPQSPERTAVIGIDPAGSASPQARLSPGGMDE
jgi:DNA-binding transcriptional ArsR family regulator